MRQKITVAFMITALMAVSVCGCKENSTSDDNTTGTQTDNTLQNTQTNQQTSTFVDFNYEAESDEENEATVAVEINGELTGEGADVTVTATEKNTITFTDDGVESEADGVKLDGNTVNITEAGTYIITGETEDGQIYVDTEDKETVWIILTNAKISNKTNSPIYIANAKKTIISAATGTDNTLTDATEYEYAVEEDEEPNSCIFSKDDLVLSGNGKLTVKGNFNNGITSKDTLEINDIELTVTAKNNAIKGKDNIIVKSGNIKVDSEDAGLKSDNTNDTELGYIYIVDGNIDITSEGDAIHTDNNVQIDGGNITISSEDDGIHADNGLKINGGVINITNCYEGLEADYIIINDGDVDIVASDDGINAATPSDSTEDTTTNGRPQMGGGFSNGTSVLTINGGEVYVNAKGDGLDSNGSIVMTGGTVYVDGPEDNGNGALDYDKTFNVTGGTLIVSGSSGMMQTVSNTSTVNCIAVVTTSTQNASEFILKDSSGNTVVEYTPAKRYNSIVVCTADIKTGETYTAYFAGNEEGSVTVSSIVNYIGQAAGGNGGFGGGNGGFGGGRKDNMNQGEMPSGEMGEMPSFGDGEMPGFENGEMPSFENGEMPTDQDGQMLERPDKQNGGRNNRNIEESTEDDIS